jgi:cupin fold WbuC family metalloprotein
MRFRQQAENILVLDGNPAFVNLAAIRRLKRMADASPLKRARICLHQRADEPIHEMLIVLARGAYIRPHRHLNKTESFHLIEGRATVVFFDDQGDVTQRHKLARTAGSAFIYRIDQSVYHTQIVHSKYLVFYEVTPGPWVPEDTEYASWAPEKPNGTQSRFWCVGGTKKPAITGNSLPCRIHPRLQCQKR